MTLELGNASYEDAKEHLKDVVSKDGGLYSLGWYLGWNPREKFATLDGQFTAEDLFAIAIYMRDHQ